MRWGARDVCYALALLPALWFFCFDRVARRVTVGYWRRLRPGLGTVAILLHSYWHIYMFACSITDRFIVEIRPRAIAFDGEGFERLDRAMSHPQGCILLSAHVGSFELATHWLSGRNRPLTLVMLDAEDPRVKEQVRRALGDRPFRIIDLSEPTSAGLAIASALNHGETCAMLGDRTAGDQAGMVSVPFLGRPARFPVGPFIAAAATGALVVPTFCVKTGWARYRCIADEPWTVDLGSRSQRQERLHAAVSRWVARLEEIVRAHPHQWNNYYPFWEP